MPISQTYNMDCKEYMRGIPDKFFDLSIVDTPYGIGESGIKNHTRSKLAIAKNYKPYAGNDSESPDIEYFNDLFRVSKNQIIWGANHFIHKIPYDSS
jgi:site-specific DNA-methyltransferase (adenine-specific)